MHFAVIWPSLASFSIDCVAAARSTTAMCPWDKLDAKVMSHKAEQSQFNDRVANA
jgi:hypothetical protein